MEKTLENIPWMLELDEELAYEANEALNRLLKQVHAGMAEQCGQYREKYTEKTFLEEEYFKNEDVLNYYYRLSERTDSALAKAVFFLGIKVGMAIKR